MFHSPTSGTQGTAAELVSFLFWLPIFILSPVSLETQILGLAVTFEQATINCLPMGAGKPLQILG